MRKIPLTKPNGTVPVLTLSITGHISCLHSFRITTSVILEILDLASVVLTINLSTDPLWDGAGCGPNNACCQLHNPPWFKSTLPQETSDDIEIRTSYSDSINNEDIIVYLIEIYVQ